MIVLKIIKKIIGTCILLAFVGFIAFSAVLYFSKPEKPPSVEDAPWLVQTSSRYYIGKSLSSKNGAPVLRDYYVFDGKHYKLVEGTIAFPESVYGKVVVVKRGK